MIVLDTSIWVEAFVKSATWAVARPLIPPAQERIVPTIVQLELAKWLYRSLPPEDADEAMVFTQMCEVVPLTTEIAVHAAELCRSHKLATADAVIYATGRIMGAQVLTCDAHCEGLSGVHYIPKV